MESPGPARISFSLVHHDILLDARQMGRKRFRLSAGRNDVQDEFDAPGRKGQKEEMPFKAGLFVPINRSPFRMTNASFYFLFPQGPGPGDIAALGDLTGHLDGGGFLRGPWRISDQQCAANAMLILLQWKSPTSWGGQRRRSPACKTPQPPTWRWLLRPACCRRPPSAKSPRRKTGRFWLSPSSLKGLRWRGGPAD